MNVPILFDAGTGYGSAKLINAFRREQLMISPRFTFVALAALALAACGGKPGAVASDSQSVAATPAGAYPAADTRGTGRTDPRDQPVPTVAGKPMWAANRMHTAEENARYQFAKNGADFGARTESDYIVKAHAFIDQPPRGVDSIDRRNGDKLLYDAKNNVFVVATKDGAPRTMFKPRTGAAYWAEQKARNAGGGARNDRGGDQN